eukprot:jgi/Mesvir1/266/Mv13604-RA.1
METAMEEEAGPSKKSGCAHGKRPSACTKCNLCHHGSFKPRCLEGCSRLCEHGSHKERCTKCKPKCKHGKAYFCNDLECRLGICVDHSFRCNKALNKSKCPWCHPGRKFSHKRRHGNDDGSGSYDADGRASVDTMKCEHGKFKFACRECGKCAHGVYRADCRQGCFERCWHGKQPDRCITCNTARCPHGKLLRCKECGLTAPPPRPPKGTPAT